MFWELRGMGISLVKKEKMLEKSVCDLWGGEFSFRGEESRGWF